MRKRTLWELVLNGTINPGDYIDYPLEIITTKVICFDTGYFDETYQEFQTEILDWRLDIVNDKPILVAGNGTKSKLILGGTWGYKNGIEIIDTIQNKLYTNSELAESSVPITEEIIRKLHHCNQKVTEPYWLGQQYENESKERGFRCANNGYIDYATLYIEEHYDFSLMGRSKEVHFMISHLGIRPVINLKQNLIVVQGKGNQDKPWKLASMK